MNTELWVNIDHVATLRQARMTSYPSIKLAVSEAEQGGAQGITMHLREDRRHIQDADVFAAKELITTKLNLEMAATDEMVEIALKLQPDECCIVPEKREELTTEGGLDVVAYRSRIQDACSALTQAGIKVSLFIEPAAQVIDLAKEVGAQIIELHTGQYAESSGAEQTALAQDIAQAAHYATSLGLQANAGHGLHRDNVRAIAQIEPIAVLNIGHAIIADAVFCGLSNAVRAMKEAMQA